MIEAAWARLAGYPEETRFPRQADPGLTPAERERAARFRLPGRRLQYLAGHRLLREVAAGVLGVPPEAIALPAEGRPSVADAAGPVWLTLSHSGPFAIALASDEGPVGADLESTARDRDWAGLAAGLEWPAEAGSKDAFLRTWTLREAEFKSGMREGEGLAWQAMTPEFCLTVVASSDSPLRWRMPGPPGMALRRVR